MFRFRNAEAFRMRRLKNSSGSTLKGDPEMKLAITAAICLFAVSPAAAAPWLVPPRLRTVPAHPELHDIRVTPEMRDEAKEEDARPNRTRAFHKKPAAVRFAPQED